MMQVEKRKQVHLFMEKFSQLQRVMRKTHDGKKKFIFLLITMHEINPGQAFTTSQLAQKMDVTNAASSQMVEKLVKVGFVKRESDENDRRVTWVSLTDKGKEQLRIAYKEASDFIEGMIDYIGEEDTKIMLPIMDKVLEYAEKMSNKDLES